MGARAVPTPPGPAQSRGPALQRPTPLLTACALGCRATRFAPAGPVNNRFGSLFVTLFGAAVATVRLNESSLFLCLASKAGAKGRDSGPPDAFEARALQAVVEAKGGAAIGVRRALDTDPSLDVAPRQLWGVGAIRIRLTLHASPGRAAECALDARAVVGGRAMRRAGVRRGGTAEPG